ncbi:MAG: FHA domain-containing protein [Bacteroidia bacterium]|jgi:hypothetical protein|nr:FHA domain-containing protein [Bacteroidia bacterium]
MPVELSIGRKQVQNIQVHDKLADDQHAVLELWPDGVVWIKDLNSRYGTLVNNQKVGYQQLFPGDILQIGFTQITWENYIKPAPIVPENPPAALAPPPPVQTPQVNMPQPASSQKLPLFFNHYTLLIFVLLSMALGGWLLGLLTK